MTLIIDINYRHYYKHLLYIIQTYFTYLIYIIVINIIMKKTDMTFVKIMKNFFEYFLNRFALHIQKC